MARRRLTWVQWPADSADERESAQLGHGEDALPATELVGGFFLEPVQQVPPGIGALDDIIG
jgi:hypothetical protein